MAQWHDGKIVNRVDWNDHLFSLQFQCDQFPKFVAGQFTKVGLTQADNTVLSRPYSLVNSPNDEYLEIIAVPVEQGSLSPKLHELKIGDSVKVMSPATGFLVLNEVPQSDILFLIATGTGIGPFLSILESDEIWTKYKHVVLVYGVRHNSDLAYQQKIQKWLELKSTQFHFVPIVSRQQCADALTGRIPELIRNGDIQRSCGFEFDPITCQVMLCGNPEMIKDTLEVLSAFGLKKHLRRSPGQISVERYW
ncbi:MULTISPECIES: ferredoxin--NADP reductase [Alteromonadaceae]|uniref:ferredoxin--NADP reductase n=1 Tax=Alteromonadaceae TaxID=72275 RepID=UPI001C09260C|nr:MULTISPECIES: ferredoxin--NADP reductase [Aliiglaciecola]MBU2879515.1 ferredoxin--NADP reductase [Aliiglaciecola lipolytica]MDO6712564.1 ferredoxin--NADP reductase [Aliiglaciecola sp. 2_MG-2023]MDO6753692.1 ferredoxin--NADP reductase [Aliiglaciecola sp. 1_MG-2023]